MSSESTSGDQTPEHSGEAADARQPEWADGLRQLYDSVVDEPLPDTFKDLLDQLDDAGPDDGQTSDEASAEGCEADGSDEGHG